MENTSENKMGVMPVGRLLITMALPMMVSMLVQALYNVVDSIFVSQISEDALSAVSMAFPMQNLMIGVAAGLGVGTNAILSRALGAKKNDMANQTAINGIFLAFVSYIVFLILGLTISRTFFVIQGASESISDYGEQYLSICTVASIGIFGQIMFERLLQSTGRTFFTMITQGSGAIINIIMDPILIFGYFGAPEMGIAGAAAATVLGQIAACIAAIIMNLVINKEIHISFIKYRLSLKLLLNILRIGVPSVIMIAIGSIMTFSVNKILIAFTSTAVAVFGVYFKIQSFAFMPVFGLNNGMIPIVAYNYGAKKSGRMLRARKLSIITAEIIMVIAFCVLQIFPKQLLALFNASDSMYEIGIPALRIISLSFLFAGFCIISSTFFQALGQSMYSMLISFTRQLVFLLPLAWIFAQTGKISTVWFAWPIAEVASVLVSMLFQRKVYRELIKPLETAGA